MLLKLDQRNLLYFHHGKKCFFWTNASEENNCLTAKATGLLQVFTL